MMKKTHVRISIYASKWPSVISTASALDVSFITEHDAMNLQDNEWTKMVNSQMDTEDNEYLINEEID